jgi:hypothetical protein
MALHAKAKAEAGYRFYALYDKISREDILAHAYAQCRSNKGAPGVDGQDFADIEAYGVQRWLGELALALRQETYRPNPIRRVYIPKADGKLRPLVISTLRDRVCMTAAMLVLEPIFEADLPPEQYAYSVAASSHCRSSRTSAKGCSGRAKTRINYRNTSWKRRCASCGGSSGTGGGSPMMSFTSGTRSTISPAFGPRASLNASRQDARSASLLPSSGRIRP